MLPPGPFCVVLANAAAVLLYIPDATFVPIRLDADHPLSTTMGKVSQLRSQTMLAACGRCLWRGVYLAADFLLSPYVPPACRSPSTRTGASRAAATSAAATTPTCSPTSAAVTPSAWTAAAGCCMSAPTTRATSTSCGAATTPTTSSGWASTTPSAPAALSLT